MHTAGAKLNLTFSRIRRQWREVGAAGYGTTLAVTDAGNEGTSVPPQFIHNIFKSSGA
jgi:hypothetical protein